MPDKKTRARLGLPETRHELNPRHKPVRANGLRPRRKAQSAILPISPEKRLPAVLESASRAVSGVEKTRQRASVEEPRRTPKTEVRIVSERALLAERSPEQADFSECGSDKLSPRRRQNTGIRISKLMAERGLCSRREADAYIERGWVYVDGRRVAELGARAHPSVQISLDKAARTAQRRQVTILLNKPLGYVSGQPEPGCLPAVTLIHPENQWLLAGETLFSPSHLKGLAPAGRLDVNSTGLLVLTQDGRVARQLVGETSNIEKEYLVRVEGALDDAGLALLRHGLRLDGKALKPARVEPINANQLRFILNEGRKRQIRRMCELVGLRVIGLKRVRIGKVRLGGLPLGQWRYLSENELF